MELIRSSIFSFSVTATKDRGKVKKLSSPDRRTSLIITVVLVKWLWAARKVVERMASQV
jgi:hypothetical protein